MGQFVQFRSYRTSLKIMSLSWKFACRYLNTFVKDIFNHIKVFKKFRRRSGLSRRFIFKERKPRWLSPKDFFGSKRKFFSIKLPFLVLRHPVHLIGWLSCEFEHHRFLTVNFRSVLVYWIPKKKLETVFGSKCNFFPIKVPFLLLLHAAHLIEWLSCDFEHYRSQTMKLRTVLV